MISFLCSHLISLMSFSYVCKIIWIGNARDVLFQAVLVSPNSLADEAVGFLIHILYLTLRWLGHYSPSFEYADLLRLVICNN